MKCYTLIIMQVSLVVFLGSQVAAAELIVNGSFEDPVIGLPRAWDYFASIPGWTGGVAGIEVQVDGVGDFTARGITAGEQFAELDTTMNSSMYQDVPTNTGSVYELSFAYAPRQSLASRSVDSNDIEVMWEGIQVAHLEGTSSPEMFRQEEWVTHTFLLEANSQSGLSRLEFVARGTSDSAGGLIDRVSIDQVPEPSSLFILTLCGLFIARRYGN